MNYLYELHIFISDCFEVGFDIQHYYALHQSLTLEDLAKATSKHTLKGLVKVINKVSFFQILWKST